MPSYDNSVSKIIEVSAKAPCVHCSKPDWCYQLGELTACKRGAEPATGWERTNKADKDGTPYYAPVTTRKAIRAKAKKEFFYHSRDGQQLVKVTRTDDGEGTRKFWQSHWNGHRWIKGVPDEIQKKVPIYRYQQVRKAISSGRPIYVVEGEGCADALWNVGLAATTTLGGSGKYRSYGNYLEDLAGADLILCPDRDETGVKHMEEIGHDYPNAQWLYAPPGDWYWQHLPKSGGLDVADWLTSGATAEDLKAAVGDRKFGQPQAPYVEASADMNEISADIPNDELLTIPTPDEVFTQKACDALYGDTRYISLDNNLYRWIGTHYELVSTPAEKARIAQWCNSTPVETAKGWQYSYAKAHSVESIWNWVIVVFSIDPGRVNPPGLNCLSGVLKISWQKKVPSWELVPHDPQVAYTYVGEFYFNPDADPTICDLLLSCLEPEQQEIFIRTLAASLDLRTIRKLRGQRIRALLCKGDGNNGKDSLREAVQLLYGGAGVVSATVDDFAQYQQGRKFTLAKLEHARVSWSSENSNFSQLDRLQSLKAAITGEALDFEPKHQQERPMYPACIFLFNINDVPNLQASLEAMQSRWAILSFTKTFKVGADPSRGEIEADPRFRYDPDFLQQEVVPALLNKMLAALAEAATKPINYRCTEQALQDVQREANHLWAFCQDVGLNYRIGGRIFIGELWEMLFQWYLDNGYVEVTADAKGKQKKEWFEPTHHGDKAVKANKDVYKRFSEIFPKIKRLRNTSGENKNEWYISGIAHGEAGGANDGAGGANGGANGGAGGANGGANGGAESLAQCAGGAGGAKSPSLDHLLSEIQKLLPADRKLVISPLTDEREGTNFAPPAPPALQESVSAPPFAPPFAPPAPPVAPLADSSFSGMNNVNSCSSGISGSNTVNLSNKSGNISLGSTTKNFPVSNVPHFKVGDKCKVVHPGIWGIPANRVLTIKSIDGEIATVTYDGCRSMTGCEVLMSDLIPVEDV